MGSCEMNHVLWSLAIKHTHQNNTFAYKCHRAKQTTIMGAENKQTNKQKTSEYSIIFPMTE